MALLKLGRATIKLFFEIYFQEGDKLSTEERFERLKTALKEKDIEIEKDKRILLPVMFWTECFFSKKDETIMVIRQVAKKQRLNLFKENE